MCQTPIVGQPRRSEQRTCTSGSLLIYTLRTLQPSLGPDARNPPSSLVAFRFHIASLQRSLACGHGRLNTLRRLPTCRGRANGLRDWFFRCYQRDDGLSRMQQSCLDLGIQTCLVAITNRRLANESDLCLLVRFVGLLNEVAPNKGRKPR